MYQLLNTLYVTLPDAYLCLDNATLRVELEHETRLRVPLHHLCGVVCFGHVGLSAPLMHRLAEEGISLVLLDDNGRFKARLEGATSGNVLLRHCQHQSCDSPEVTLEIARACVAGKIRNDRQILLRGAREAESDADRQPLSRAADDLGVSLRNLPLYQNADELRGREGEAALRYFSALNLLVRADLRGTFSMQGRNRRPPRDPLNALLSFAYSMWMNDCRSAIEAVGLDPQIGFLHTIRPGRAALALDLQEEFRAMADRLVMTLINRRQITETDFEQREGGAVLLKGDARKTFVVAYQERKKETLTHPLLAQPVPLGLIPLVQARLLARVVRGETPSYQPFLLR